MFYSPLRYPGGKSKLSKFIEKICVDNHISGHYIEPYAGGASVALYLLLEKRVDKITINDFDRSIYAFWWAVLNRTDELCEQIKDVQVDIDTWRKMKNVQKNRNHADLFSLGFSTLFLNRTNRSGILNAGAIGGLEQKGEYKIDCRFNKAEIIKKIELIANHKEQIKLYNLDALDLIEKTQDEPQNNIIYYFDPPYYLKGPRLYLNAYKKDDHCRLAEKIKKIKNAHWIISYDNSEEIKNMYTWVDDSKTFGIHIQHSAHTTRQGKEILFFSNSLATIDTSLAQIT